MHGICLTGGEIARAPEPGQSITRHWRGIFHDNGYGHLLQIERDAVSENKNEYGGQQQSDQQAAAVPQNLPYFLADKGADADGGNHVAFPSLEFLTMRMNASSMLPAPPARARTSSGDPSSSTRPAS